MKDIINLINTNNSFALFCHISPDADALGSMNALNLALKKMHKKVYIYCDGKVPRNISFLKVNLEKNTSLIENIDVCIMLDCNSMDRLGCYAKYYEKAKIKAIIDHHQKDNYKFDVEYVDSSSPSTADILCELFKTMKVKINALIALNLYAGLSSDTGCFVHPNTNIYSHIHSSELIEQGFNLENANYNMFKFKPRNYLRFYKTALRNTKQFLRGKLYITTFNLRAYRRFSKICDESFSFQFLDGIDGNEIRARITEKESGVFTLSFRSNKFANVCLVAEKFGGGGHIRASGATYSGSLKEVVPLIIDACREELGKAK
ncbi:MAG: bifunctional oligoribonuclease/PAP phosphatase NrnA [Clostridia bacterium]|nr:bifunctional oligoribonuclease/PAP phosphatase NrnA [Clostridia bacterium]